MVAQDRDLAGYLAARETQELTKLGDQGIVKVLPE
jgi:hypothetical protein